MRLIISERRAGETISVTCNILPLEGYITPLEVGQRGRWITGSASD
jgi:hypothetical protein